MFVPVKEKAPTRPSGFLQSNGRGWVGDRPDNCESVVSPSLIVLAIRQHFERIPTQARLWPSQFFPGFRDPPTLSNAAWVPGTPAFAYRCDAVIRHRGLDDIFVVCPPAVHGDDPCEEVSLAKHLVNRPGVDDERVSLVEGEQHIVDVDHHSSRENCVDLRPPEVIVAILVSDLGKGRHLPVICHDHRTLLALLGRKPRSFGRLRFLFLEDGGDNMLAGPARGGLECRVGGRCLLSDKQAGQISHLATLLWPVRSLAPNPTECFMARPLWASSPLFLTCLRRWYIYFSMTSNNNTKLSICQYQSSILSNN